MKLQNQKDISYRVANELNLPRDLVEHVISQLWKAIRYFLTHPLEAKSGILLTGLGIFKMTEYTLREYLSNLLKQTEGRITEKVKFYQTLIKYHGKTRRQKK